MIIYNFQISRLSISNNLIMNSTFFRIHSFVMGRLIILLFLLLIGSQHSMAKSSLPACSDDLNAKRDNCYGEMSWDNGSKYAGEFKKNKMNGRGLWVGYDGSRYEGDFKDNYYNGYGILTKPSGENYKGEFQDGMYHGHGILTKPNNQVIEGNFIRNNLNGVDQSISPALGEESVRSSNNDNIIKSKPVYQSSPNQPPFRCVFDPTFVACDVRINEVNITNVLLNRGNCESPIPSERDIQIFNEKMRKTSSGSDPVIMSKDQLIKSMTILGYAMRGFTTGPDHDNALPIARAALNPIGTFRFGDTLQILNTCPNLAEVTIVFNGLSASTQDGVNWMK